MIMSEDTAIDRADRAFNKMRAQLDWLVEAMKWQNEVLAQLAEKAEQNSCQQGEGGDDQRGDGNQEGLTA